MTARLAAGLWVSAYLARLRLAAIPAYLAAKGDPTAGAVAVKVATMDGRASVFVREYGPDGARLWAPLVTAATEAEADEALARQRRFDPDLWIVEIEDPKGRTLLGEEGLD